MVFPLVWHFGGKEKSTTVIAPLLFVDLKRPQKRTTVLFPLYWRFDRAGHRTYFVVNTYYSHSKRDDTFNFWFIPLLQVQRRRPGDFKWDFLAGVAGYERVGKNRQIKILFIPIDLEPTSTKTLSGFGGTQQSVF